MSRTSVDSEAAAQTVAVLFSGARVGERERSLFAVLKWLQEDSESPRSFRVLAPTGDSLARLAAENDLDHREIRWDGKGPSATGLEDLAREAEGVSVLHAWGTRAARLAARSAIPAAIVWQLEDEVPRAPVRWWLRRRVHCFMAWSPAQFERARIPMRHPLARHVPHALLPSRVREGARESWRGRTPVVGMIGRYSLRENHHVFLQMAKIISQRQPDVDYRIAGSLGASEKSSRSYADALGQLVRNWGLEKQVTFSGKPADRQTFFDGIDLLVEPSTEAGASMLGLLAMAQGIPVVATRSGGFARLIESGNTGWLTLPRDARGLAQATRFLLQSPDIALEMGERARETVRQQNDLVAVARKLGVVYEELVQR